jgi:hypothetical protein
MATTADGARIGQTIWRAVVYFDDGTEIWARCMLEQEFPEASRAAAERLVRDALAAQENPPRPASGRFWGHVQRGTYRDASFDAPEYGEHVTDATWEPDEVDGAYVGTYFWLNDNGAVEEGEL